MPLSKGTAGESDRSQRTDRKGHRSVDDAHDVADENQDQQRNTDDPDDDEEFPTAGGLRRGRPVCFVGRPGVGWSVSRLDAVADVQAWGVFGSGAGFRVAIAHGHSLLGGAGECAGWLVGGHTTPATSLTRQIGAALPSNSGVHARSQSPGRQASRLHRNTVQSRHSAKGGNSTFSVLRWCG